KSVIYGSGGFVNQTNYGYQFMSTRAGTLWIEGPMTFTWQGRGTVSGTTVASIARNAWYFTPGVRLKTPTYGRVSLYGVIGGGTGSLYKIDNVVVGTTPTVLTVSTLGFHPVLDFGGGI